MHRAGGKGDQHRVAGSCHGEQDGHLHPAEAHEPKEQPDGGGDNMARCDVGVSRLEDVAIDGSQREAERQQDDVADLLVAESSFDQVVMKDGTFGS